MDQIKNVKAILLCYEAVSGLKINFFKNELIGAKVEQSILVQFANILGVQGGLISSFVFRSSSLSWLC